MIAPLAPLGKGLAPAKNAQKMRVIRSRIR
jgi:hypothetical protein